jgi:hypothetical protein
MMEAAAMGRQNRHTGEMLPLLQRHEIQVLGRAGFGAQDVATRTSTSVDTVRRVRREDAVTHVNDPAEHLSTVATIRVSPVETSLRTIH